MTTVTGPVGATYDAVFDGIVATLTRTGGVVGYEGGAIAPDQKTYITGGGGVLTMPDLKPGRYTLSLSVPISENTSVTKLWEAAGSIPADAGDNITLEAFLDKNAETITPRILQQAIAARDAAEAAVASLGKMVAITQEDYDSLSPPEQGVFYFIAPTGVPTVLGGIFSVPLADLDTGERLPGFVYVGTEAA